MAEAADWFARQDAGPLTAEERQAFQAWLGESADNRDAYAQIEGTWTAFDEVPARDVPASDLSMPAGTPDMRPARPSKRRPLAALAIAASLMAAAVLAPDLMLRVQADAMTAVGEVRELPLPDGSLAILNTDTAIAVDFGPEGRRVTLLKGEAEFIVEADADRPFSVAAEGGRATALGTTFAVRDIGDGAR